MPRRKVHGGAQPLMKLLRRASAFASQRRLRFGLLRSSLFIAALCWGPLAGAAPRRITIDLIQARQPVDRFFDLSVGSDFPGTLIRPEAQAQLKTDALERRRSRRAGLAASMNRGPGQ
jgi:hypothetical protein